MAREPLLDRIVDHLLEHGLGDASLRELGTAVGSSHRMLLYHFGSREALLSAVVDEVERRQAVALDGLRKSGSPYDVILSMHARLHSGELDSIERLFFELYGRGLRGDEAGRRLADPGVRTWIDALVELYESFGFPAREARGEATLALATARGLLLDRLATGDSRRVDAAARLYATGVMDRLSDRANSVPLGTG